MLAHHGYHGLLCGSTAEFRFSRELSLMALMIVDSMRSLMWAMLMLMLMIFVFAVWFTTNSTYYLREYADTNRFLAKRRFCEAFQAVKDLIN